MTKVVASNSLNMAALVESGSLQSLFADGTVATSTSTLFVLHYADGFGFSEELSLTGTFGGYDADGFPTTGTVTGVTYSVLGAVLFTVSDLSISVEQFTSFVNADDVHGLFEIILSGSDVLEGSAFDDELIGFAGDDQLIGGDGSDYLVGGAGKDAMAGGAGDDIYFVDNADDRVIEALDEGYDGVYSSLNYGLKPNIEALVLVGTENINAYGNAENNTITGNIGNNLINGGAGADYMYGDEGDDTYIVDNTLDYASELSEAGYDIVKSSATYSLKPNVEVLALTGTADINGYGNELANKLFGNDGINQLNGFEGADIMRGNGGSDTYYVDNAADRVFERAGGGDNDFVVSSVTFGLKANIETLQLSGMDNINGFGTNGRDSIYGNSGNNLLNGNGGSDIMMGGAGNDTYIVDASDEILFESVNHGIDTVKSSASFALAGNIEVLALQGSAAINGTGNTHDNKLFGNIGDNILKGQGGADRLFGGDGNDSLYGGTGSDELNGGAGSDLFFFDTAPGFVDVDVITDFSAADDAIHLARSVFTLLGTGTLAAEAFVVGTSAADADDRIIYDSATGNLFYDADGSGAGGQVLFATVDAGTVLSNADFIAF